MGKTAITTPFGLFEFPFMTFGLKNAGSFQRFMDNVLRGLDFVRCYIDDLIVASNNEEEHTEHIRIVLDKLKEYGLTISVEKCQFGKTEVTYLGHRINANGIKPLDEKMKAINEFKKP